MVTPTDPRHLAICKCAPISLCLLGVAYTSTPADTCIADATRLVPDVLMHAVRNLYSGSRVQRSRHIAVLPGIRCPIPGVLDRGMSIEAIGRDSCAIVLCWEAPE